MDRHKLFQLDNQIGELLRHGSPSCIRQANAIMVENFECVSRFALDLTEPKPKPKHTIADNYPAGGLTASEPCMFCEDYEKLQAENEALKESVSFLKKYDADIDGLSSKIKQLKAENKRKDKALDIVFKRLDTGSHSYHKHYHGGCILCEIEKALNNTIDRKDK